jgi:hypothetical protein
MMRLRLAIACTGLGLLFALALLIRETPYTFTAFMFLAQPLLGLGMLLFASYALGVLRRQGVL